MPLRAIEYVNLFLKTGEYINRYFNQGAMQQNALHLLANSYFAVICANKYSALETSNLPPSSILSCLTTPSTTNIA